MRSPAGSQGHRAGERGHVRGNGRGKGAVALGERDPYFTSQAVQDQILFAVAVKVALEGLDSGQIGRQAGKRLDVLEVALPVAECSVEKRGACTVGQNEIGEVIPVSVDCTNQLIRSRIETSGCAHDERALQGTVSIAIEDGHFELTYVKNRYAQLVIACEIGHNQLCGRLRCRIGGILRIERGRREGTVTLADRDADPAGSRGDRIGEAVAVHVREDRAAAGEEGAGDRLLEAVVSVAKSGVNQVVAVENNVGLSIVVDVQNLHTRGTVYEAEIAAGDDAGAWRAEGAVSVTQRRGNRVVTRKLSCPSVDQSDDVEFAIAVHVGERERGAALQIDGGRK